MEKDFSMLRMLLVSSATLVIFMLLVLISPISAVWCLVIWLIYTVINLLYFWYKIWREKNPKLK